MLVSGSRDLSHPNMEKKTVTVCPVCEEPGAALGGLLHCCLARVCIPCIFKLIDPKGATWPPCPLCGKNVRDAVMKKIREDERLNPDEAHVDCVCLPSIHGAKVPLTHKTTAREVLETLSDRAGINLAHQVEGGFFDYRLVCRDRQIPLNQTLAEVAHWHGGVVRVSVVESRTR